MAGPSALDLLDSAIEELEARLNFPPEEETVLKPASKKAPSAVKPEPAHVKPTTDAKEGDDLPDICKLEFKVGVITKVWVHESADKLYCEEIDVGEEVPRQIASGLRNHFTLDEMIGQRLLVVAN
jgi:aminoacyl tRNA synthase complex-interacting multifunctional protein 1